MSAGPGVTLFLRRTPPDDGSFEIDMELERLQCVLSPLEIMDWIIKTGRVTRGIAVAVLSFLEFNEPDSDLYQKAEAFFKAHFEQGSKDFFLWAAYRVVKDFCHDGYTVKLILHDPKGENLDIIMHNIPSQELRQSFARMLADITREHIGHKKILERLGLSARKPGQ